MFRQHCYLNFFK